MSPRSRRSMESAVKESLAKIIVFGVVLLSLGIGLSLGPKPSTVGPNDGDLHYGEGPTAVFNDYQFKKLDAIKKAKGFVTRDDFEAIAADTGEDDDGH